MGRMEGRRLNHPDVPLAPFASLSAHMPARERAEWHRRMAEVARKGGIIRERYGMDPGSFLGQPLIVHQAGHVACAAAFAPMEGLDPAL